MIVPVLATGKLTGSTPKSLNNVDAKAGDQDIVDSHSPCPLKQDESICKRRPRFPDEATQL